MFASLATLAHSELEKWFPVQGERGHSSYFRCFQKQNRGGGDRIKTTGLIESERA